MNKRRDTTDDLDIESLIANYLRDERMRRPDIEKVMLDNKYKDITDKVMRKHWDSIPSQMPAEETNKIWKHLRKQAKIEKLIARFKIHGEGVFGWAVAAIVLLAIAVNIYLLHHIESGEVINSPSVVASLVKPLVDSLPLEPLREEVEPQKIAQAASTPVEPVEELAEIEEIEEEKILEQPVKQKDQLVEHVTRAGETLQIRLTDGTDVKLHENTSVIADISDSARTISLHGKAHFTVASNENLSFRVSAQNMLVEVLGTEFEVDAYADGEYLVVRVDKGSVKVTTPDNVRFTLHPSQVLVFDNKSHSVSFLKSVPHKSAKKKKK